MGMLLLETLKAAEAKTEQPQFEDEESEDEDEFINAIVTRKWPQDIPVKNGFIHFEAPRTNGTGQQDALPRGRTAPAATFREAPNFPTLIGYSICSGTAAIAKENVIDEAEASEEVPCAASEEKGGEAGQPPLLAAAPPEEDLAGAPEDQAAQPPLPMQEDPHKEEAAAAPEKEANGAAETPPPSAERPSHEEKAEQMGSSWFVDGRRLRGRDTRICTTLRPRIGARHECGEFVVTIYPKSVCQKRGGSNFKAAGSVGTFQVKSNKPLDMDLGLRVTVGSKWSSCQLHNFSKNPLMIFQDKDGKHEECHFHQCMDVDADRTDVLFEVVPAEEATTWFDDRAEGSPGGAANSGGGSGVADGEEHDPQSSAPASDPPWSVVTPPGSPQVTPRHPVNDSGNSTPTARPPVQSSPFVDFDGQGVLFGFTIRRADGVELGMEVVPDEDSQELVVQEVLENGAVAAWNRLCVGTPTSVKEVKPNDRVVSVNDKTGCCESMLDECRNKQLLKLVVVRGECVRRYETHPLGWPVPVYWIPVEVPIGAPAYPWMPMWPAGCWNPYDNLTPDGGEQSAENDLGQPLATPDGSEQPSQNECWWNSDDAEPTPIPAGSEHVPEVSRGQSSTDPYISDQSSEGGHHEDAVELEKGGDALDSPRPEEAATDCCGPAEEGSEEEAAE
mmetsp:Transcript_104676/g.181896  ORF Transcript_104676/g.181896 Transcript_104676/m.181896 type:complete len:672 (-) Transcript_104676:93-2108(-)